MHCTAKGVVALVLCFVTAGLSWTQFIIPLWLVSDNDIGKSSAIQSIGVAGLCFETNHSNGIVCASYFSAPSPINEVERANLPTSRPNLPYSLSNQSICALYAQTNDGDKLDIGGAYPKEVLNDEFLERTCGSLGSSTLTFAISTSILGTLMFVALAVWTCATTTKSCMLALSKLLAFAALVANLLTITMWFVQQSSLHVGAGVSLGLSFFLSVASATLYCGCITAIGMLRLKERHERFREKSLRLQSIRDLERAASIKRAKSLSARALTVL
ncbi:hypothetical protein H257_00842 [Aphanomyces astaci]|uniref:Uncharacterized protein n=1 Tax=Aphanomyces astaci TaxID=112090 RepID=W4HER2_APHAT|nr:hypothetical protein H257_00842 [Aphanomyces astaci]ETV89638.1 hypothetical protein H257_00842 [Aphanomyces astaci]|eukprot:XP_009822038.1 hypothetical protein H257_00842 [Aphanomyces astaci]